LSYLRRNQKLVNQQPVRVGQGSDQNGNLVEIGGYQPLAVLVAGTGQQVAARQDCHDPSLLPFAGFPPDLIAYAGMSQSSSGVAQYELAGIILYRQGMAQVGYHQSGPPSVGGSIQRLSLT
jgi:hypothetical protein